MRLDDLVQLYDLFGLFRLGLLCKFLEHTDELSALRGEDDAADAVGEELSSLLVNHFNKVLFDKAITLILHAAVMHAQDLQQLSRDATFHDFLHPYNSIIHTTASYILQSQGDIFLPY